MTTKPKRWNVHEHRDELIVSDQATVYHPERGQLCFVEKHWDCLLFHPVIFKDKGAAQRWIREGTIAEIQEGLSILGIGFSLTCFEKRTQEWEG